MKKETARDGNETGGTDWRKARRRKRGTGCMIRRGKVFYARLVIGGRILVRSLHTGDVRKARQAFADFIRPYELGNRARTLENLKVRIGDVSQELKQWENAQPSLALSDAFTAYERSGARRDISPRSLETYRADFVQFETWIKGNRPNVREMRDITEADAEAYAASIRRTLSPGTQNKRITVLRGIWRTLADDDSCKSATATDAAARPARLSGNPFDRIRARHDSPHVRRELTVDELARVCASLSGEMRLLFAVGIYTGLRLGDCALLDWGNVDIARRMISVIPRKTERHAHGRRVIIPIHSTLAAMLAETPPEARRGHVMPGIAETYTRNPANLCARTKRVFTHCGITTNTPGIAGRMTTDVSFHSLRHTFVSLAANAGVPLAIVQAIVGHSNPAMTRHYFHESTDALKNAVATLPDVCGTLHALPAPDAPQADLGGIAAMLDGMSRERLQALRCEIEKRLAVA